jgi:hypothetical protein
MVWQQRRIVRSRFLSPRAASSSSAAVPIALRTVPKSLTNRTLVLPRSRPGDGVCGAFRANPSHFDRAFPHFTAKRRSPGSRKSSPLTKTRACAGRSSRLPTQVPNLLTYVPRAPGALGDRGQNAEWSAADVSRKVSPFADECPNSGRNTAPPPQILTFSARFLLS